MHDLLDTENRLVAIIVVSEKDETGTDSVLQRALHLSAGSGARMAPMSRWWTPIHALRLLVTLRRGMLQDLAFPGGPARSWTREIHGKVKAA
jgi:hypothetical protein